MAPRAGGGGGGGRHSFARQTGWRGCRGGAPQQPEEGTADSFQRSPPYGIHSHRVLRPTPHDTARKAMAFQGCLLCRGRRGDERRSPLSEKKGRPPASPRPRWMRTRSSAPASRAEQGLASNRTSSKAPQWRLLLTVPPHPPAASPAPAQGPAPASSSLPRPGACRHSSGRGAVDDGGGRAAEARPRQRRMVQANLGGQSGGERHRRCSATFTAKLGANQQKPPLRSDAPRARGSERSKKKQKEKRKHKREGGGQTDALSHPHSPGGRLGVGVKEEEHASPGGGRARAQLGSPASRRLFRGSARRAKGGERFPGSSSSSSSSSSARGEVRAGQARRERRGRRMKATRSGRAANKIRSPGPRWRPGQRPSPSCRPCFPRPLQSLQRRLEEG